MQHLHLIRWSLKEFLLNQMHSKKDIACRLLPLSMVVARKTQLCVCPDKKLCFLREVIKQHIHYNNWFFATPSVPAICKTKSGLCVLLSLWHERDSRLTWDLLVMVRCFWVFWEINMHGEQTVCASENLQSR